MFRRFLHWFESNLWQNDFVDKIFPIFIYFQVNPCPQNSITKVKLMHLLCRLKMDRCRCTSGKTNMYIKSNPDLNALASKSFGVQLHFKIMGWSTFNWIIAIWYYFFTIVFFECFYLNLDPKGTNPKCLKTPKLVTY